MAAVRRAGTVGRGRAAMPDRRDASGAGRGGHPNALFGAALDDRLRLVLLRHLPRRGDVDRRAADRGERPVHKSEELRYGTQGVSPSSSQSLPYLTKKKKK